MKYIILNRALIFAALVLASETSSAKDASLSLTCNSNNKELVAMRQAHGAVRRVNKHVLDLAFKSGTRRFIDKPPHGPLSGLHWRYCGFNEKKRVHLIGMNKERQFSGQLMFESNGKPMKAGHTVLFSRNGDKFLAIEQEDGMDGELWTVYGVDGKMKWTGYAGTIIEIDGIESVASTFTHPTWDQAGELAAQFTCADGSKTGAAALRPVANTWNWQGPEACTP